MSLPKPVESRSPQSNWQHTQKAEGLCPKCPNKVDRNPRTGKPYYECASCRKVTAAAKKLLMQERRKRGIA